MPRDTLTREQIVRTAVELLDTDGLEGLNMRALGKRLNSAATAVYWHVKNKDDLLTLAGDQVWDEIRLPDLDAVDWRAAATAMARDLYAMFTRHPWLVQALATHLFHGTGKARHDDHTLAVYEKAGFIGPQADRAAGAVFTYVLGNATGPAATTSLTRRIEREGGDADEAFGAVMKDAVEAASGFPRLRDRIGSYAGTDYAEAPDATFDFGLESLLDGLEARARRRAA
ncbi:TetR family transcriptional regulator [Streptomyces agglomeratus]|uniref:TetR/AcrR family transcriptional regulator n=1 Tax=Streptomyces agglomeratus TaxID=285458 RepID=UPI000852708A|nr:TetR/AcrR family transcriptional regulator C-terminal domain-containing protein [Streptomyces agglomeratus]OEJ37351.1 TetR family transcriptional regulator [Streptomyces agglomeratus]OEJ48267.1 TetR family transcriptional regulator [Streptomyces agglomeratus]OEJ49891.1 TetR family transcriptional regulator [Streptomyces agglomeratus]OEJ57220.1 TetR family transcriptional regulator [Streptomyces agglomeratus]